MLDPRLLRSFVAIADTGSFTQAAEWLNMTQSTISQQLARLEEAVGRGLIDRVAREGDRVAIDFGGQQIPYRELRTQALALRAVLAGRGVRARDRVAVLLPNSPFAVALYLAVAACGA